MANQKYHVAAFYFPNFHIDPLNTEQHGPGWTEWELVRHATPRFEGHRQPRVPAWGYEDEADPAVMAKKIGAAAGHGVDTFLFDWYFYDNGPFLNRCLEEGFLHAGNAGKMNFALMWANHDWGNIHPKALRSPAEMCRKGCIRKETFWKAVDYMIGTYFRHPSYLRVRGGLFLSFYQLAGLIEIFGGVEEAAGALRETRRRVRAAGLGELHLNTMAWSRRILPAEKLVSDMDEKIYRLGFDSVTSYVWPHIAEMKDFPATDYAAFRDLSVREMKKIAARYKIPYFPNVTVGWDPSPRTAQSDSYENVGYPFTPVLAGNTPKEFETGLRQVREYMDSTDIPKLVTVNAWNEWTEGSYLEPDTVNGCGYLEAIRRVFG